MNGLNALYKALGNRQQEDERRRLEAERTLELERQRKQRAAANRHGGMMSTINLLGTVGGAIAGGVGGGGPAGAMAGASLGSALASGITGLAPNVAGTQPRADNPFYNAPSDSQRALAGITSGLQVYSAYEANMAQKEIQKAANDFSSWRQGHLMNPTGDGYQAVNKGMAINEETGLANYWTDPSGGGYNLDDLPFGLSKDDLLNIGTQQRDVWIQQVAPTAEILQRRGADLSYKINNLLGDTEGNKIIDNLIMLKRKGDKAGVKRVLDSIDNKQARAYIEEYYKLPPIALGYGAKAGRQLQGLSQSERSKVVNANGEAAVKAANEQIDGIVKSVDKVVDSLLWGRELDGTLITKFDKSIDKRWKELGYPNQESSPSGVTPEMWIHLAMARGGSQEDITRAAYKKWQDQAAPAFNNLADKTKYPTISDRERVLYTQAAVGLNADPSAISSKHKWVEAFTSDPVETSSASPQKTTGAAGYTPTGRYETNPPVTGAKPGGDANTSPSTPAAVPETKAPISPENRVKLNYQPTEAEALRELGLPGQMKVAPDAIRDMPSYTNVPAGQSEALTSMRRERDYTTPAPRTTGPTGLRNMYPVPSDDPVVSMDQQTRQAAEALGVDSLAFNKMVKDADQADAIAAKSVPGGPTQTPATDRFVAVQEVGEPLENGRRRFVDQYGRVAVEKPEVFEVAGYGHVVAPTLDDNGNEKSADQVAFELIDSIEASGRPLDLETGQTLPMFDSREEAEAWRDNRKEAIGETVPATVKSGSTNARTSMNTEFTEEERPQLGGRERPEQSSATSTNIRAALENAKPLSARAAGPDMQRLEAEQEALNRQDAERIESSFDEYLSMQRAKRKERELRQGNAGRGRPPTETEIESRNLRLQRAADIRNAAAAQARDNRREMSLKTMYDSEFMKGQSPSGDTSDAGRLSRLDPRQDRTAGVDPDYNSWFNEYYRERALKEALDATPERPEQPEKTGVQAELNQAFEDAGIDNLTPIMESIVNLESDGRHIKNKSGSEAFGVLQITPAVVEKYLGKSADLKDNDTYTQTAVMLFKDNESILRRNNLPVNFTNMYVLHHFGIGGYNLLAASPETQLKNITYRQFGSATPENPRGIQLPLITEKIKQQNQWLGKAAESLGVTVDRMTVGDMLNVLEQAGMTGDFPKKAGAA